MDSQTTYLSHKTKVLLRQYTEALFSDKWPVEKRRYVFYLILRKELKWLMEKLLALGLEKDEIESEIYIFCCNLYDEYDITRSSIIPYLFTVLNWKAKELLEKYSKDEELLSLAEAYDSYTIENEFYLRIPNVLFETKWLLKSLSQYQKNIILKIIEVDVPTARVLAHRCRVSKSTIATQLQNIAAELKKGYNNDRH